MARKGDNGGRMRKEVNQTKIKVDEAAVTSVNSIITSMCYLFMVDVDGIVNLSTVEVAPSNI